MAIAEISREDIEFSPFQVMGKITDISSEDIEYESKPLGKKVLNALRGFIISPKDWEEVSPPPEVTKPRMSTTWPEAPLPYAMGFETHPEFGLAKRTLEARAKEEERKKAIEESYKTGEPLLVEERRPPLEPLVRGLVPGLKTITETIGGIKPVSPELIMEPAADIAQMYLGGKVIGGVFKAIKGATWFRILTNKERGLVTQSIADMEKAGLSEGQILRNLNNPTFRKEYVVRRGAAEATRMKYEGMPPEVSPVTPSVSVEPITVKPITVKPSIPTPKGKFVDIAKEDIEPIIETKPEVKVEILKPPKIEGVTYLGVQKIPGEPDQYVFNEESSKSTFYTKSLSEEDIIANRERVKAKFAEEGEKVEIPPTEHLPEEKVLKEGIPVVNREQAIEALGMIGEVKRRGNSIYVKTDDLEHIESVDLSGGIWRRGESKHDFDITISAKKPLSQELINEAEGIINKIQEKSPIRVDVTFVDVKGKTHHGLPEPLPEEKILKEALPVSEEGGKEPYLMTAVEAIQSKVPKKTWEDAVTKAWKEGRLLENDTSVQSMVQSKPSDWGEIDAVLTGKMEASKDLLKRHPDLQEGVEKGKELTEITVGLAKPRKPEKVSDITRWVIKQGGVRPDDPNIDPIGWSRKEGGPIGLISKNARYGLDELADMLPEAGFTHMTTDELSEAISNRVRGGKAPRGYTEADIEKLQDEWDQEHMDIIESDPKLLKPDTRNALTSSIDDEIIGMKEEWREQGYSEQEIKAFVEEAYKTAKTEGVIESPEQIRANLTKPTEELVPKAIKEIKPSGLPITATYFNTPAIRFEGYAWRSMGRKEFDKLLTGELIYPGGEPKKGQYFAPTPESASQYAQKGKILVEFGGVEKAEGEGVSNYLDRINITKVWEYDGKNWIKKPLSELAPKPAPSPTRPGEQLLPGMKVGLEQPKAEAVIPTLEGTPLMEAARKAELKKVQPELFGRPIPQKTISQFTEEYKKGLGEGGFIRVAGVEKTPKVVTPGTKDISLLEFPLTALHVADRHPEIAPIIKGNIKAEQDTNNWILEYSDRFSEAFDKVEKPGIWMKVFRRKGTNIRGLDLMIEGKLIIPEELKGFVAEIKGTLGEIKGEIIQKMKDDFASFLSPKQKEYLDWVQGGKVGDEPVTIVAEYTYTNKKGKEITVPEHKRHFSQATKDAVEGALDQFKEMERWGFIDYFPHIFKGKYKYLTEDGHIIASGTTAKQAKANFQEYVESHPEAVDKTFMFVNDFYDLMTVRKVLNPELTSPLEYLGTKLSRKEFFRLLGRTEKIIKEEIATAGVEDIPKVRVDMSGIASFQKGTKFSGHFLKRKTSLRGEEIDPFRALMSYVFSVGRKLGLEDAKMASYSFADSLPANMPNAKSYIKMQADNMSGRYNIVDKIFDETMGERLGMKPFGVTRIFAKGVALESKLKLGYAPAKTAINYIGSVFHTALQEGVKNFIEGGKLIKAKDSYLMGKIASEGHLAGMEQLFAGEGLVGISEKQTALWRPLGSYQWVEVKGRTRALAAGYAAGLRKFGGDKDAAWIYALDSAQLTQFLYNTAAKPVLVRGPVASASYQFKQYLNSEIRFISQLTPKQWAGYIAGITAVAGTRGALLTLKSIIGISLIGLGIDEVMERLNRKAPRLHRGIFGLVGIDVSAPASWQIPSSVKDWIGVFPRDVLETGEMIVKGLKNNGWTDEQINDYMRQITPVGYNVFKGLQILSEGATKEGTKVMYRGGKEEGVINFAGAKSVGQSQASDSARYMNQQRQLFLEKSRVLEDKLFRSKSAEEAQNTFRELVELKNIENPEEMKYFINGLFRSAESRMMTEEARIFLTLPKALKKQEEKRR